MVWMKILDKGLIYVIQTVIIIIVIIGFGFVLNRSTKRAELSIREDVVDLRERLDKADELNREAIGLIAGVIVNNQRITDGLEEIEGDNSEHQRRVLEIQDRTLESELITDGIKQSIRGIERYNKYNREEE